MAAIDSDKKHRPFSFPRDFCPVHPFALEIPEGWTAEEAAGCVVALVEPPEPGAFRANMTVSVDHVAHGLGLEEAAAQTLAEEEGGGEDFRLESEKIVTVDGSPATLRIQTFQPAEINYRLMQLQLQFFAPPRMGAGKELFTLIGSCLADDSGLYLDDFAIAGMSLTFQEH